VGKPPAVTRGEEVHGAMVKAAGDAGCRGSRLATLLPLLLRVEGFSAPSFRPRTGSKW